jgi:hypothetical protein
VCACFEWLPEFDCSVLDHRELVPSPDAEEKRRDDKASCFEISLQNASIYFRKILHRSIDRGSRHVASHFADTAFRLLSTGGGGWLAGWLGGLYLVVPYVQYASRKTKSKKQGPAIICGLTHVLKETHSFRREGLRSWLCS